MSNTPVKPYEYDEIATKNKKHEELMDFVVSYGKYLGITIEVTSKDARITMGGGFDKSAHSLNYWTLLLPAATYIHKNLWPEGPKMVRVFDLTPDQIKKLANAYGGEVRAPKIDPRKTGLSPTSGYLGCWISHKPELTTGATRGSYYEERVALGYALINMLEAKEVALPGWGKVAIPEGCDIDE